MPADDLSISKIRNLCLRLRPILGIAADRIYSAYIAEDDTGKDQIQEYLNLLSAKHLNQTLTSDYSELLPPSQLQAVGDYNLGMVKYAQKELYPFGLREDEWIQHIAVLGRSGAGKTNTGFVILDQLKKHNKPFLIFDWKRNYRDLLSKDDFKDLEIYTIGRNLAPFAFNPLIPPAGTDPKTWLKKLNEVIAHSYCLGNGVLFLLQQAVDIVYEDAGVYDNLVTKWPTFKDVLLKARGMDTRGRESGWLSSTLRALSSLCFGDMDRLLNTNSNKSIDHILDKSVILELDSLTQSDKVFFIQSMLLWIHHKRMAEERRESFKHCILIEEAHHVLSDERRSLVGGQSVMEIIFREIREFGESLILLDQHPSKISLPALGNTYCTICMNLKHKSDINAVSQCLLLDKDKDILGSLEIGKAVVKLQGRVAKPFEVSVPHFNIQKASISDLYVKNHMKEITNELFRMETVTLSASLSDEPAQPQIESRLLSLLQDIASNPQSGVADRYKRLGISVRQGQKLKQEAIGLEFIEQSTQNTAAGRIIALKLTEKGMKTVKN
jgi:hypothetical protein